MANNNPIIAALAIFGTEAKLAAAVGVSQPAIHKAKVAGRVSAELAVKIETATEGRVPRWSSRPDLWPVPADIARPAPSESAAA